MTVACATVGVPIAAHASTGAATVAGVLTTAEGAPASGVRVTVEPMLADPPAVRDESFLLDSTVTSAAGAFALTTTPTTALVNEALDNGGTLNVEVDAVALDAKQLVPSTAGAGATSSFYAVGIAQLDLVADATVPGGYAFVSPSAISLSLKPLQTMAGDGDTVVTANAQPSAGDAPAAPDNPDDTLAATQTSVTAATSDTQTTVDNATGVPSAGVVKVNDATVNTVESTVTGATGTSDLVKEIKSYDGDGGGGSDYHTYPSDPCPTEYYSSSGQYYMTYTTYKNSNAYIPLGEVHTPSDSSATFTYVSSAKTNVGVAVKESGGSWSISGSVSVGHSSTGSNTLSIPVHTYRHIQGQFYWHDERKYYCVGSENGTYVRAYWDKRKVDSWTLNLRLAGTDLSAWDSQSRYNSAATDGRAVDYSPNTSPSYQQTTGYHYGVEAGILGVTLGAQSDWVTDVTLKYHFGGAAHHRLFGNTDGPFYAKITYCYG